MGPTNIVAHELESYGVRTFSAKEMAFNILGLMHPLLFSITQVEPIWADLNGGMDRLPDLADITNRIRIKLNKKADLRRAIARDNSADFKIINGVEAERLLQSVDVLPRANFRFDFPTLEASSSLSDVSRLRGLIDLDKVVVITGSGEVGPWGSSRTRWEMEARGELTIEGCIEMAWIMGYIKHFDGRLKDGSLYVGWVDSKTNEPVDDKDVKGRYEKEILAHAGIRLIGMYLRLHYFFSNLTFYLRARTIPWLQPQQKGLQPRGRAHPRSRAHRDIGVRSTEVQATAWRQVRYLGRRGWTVVRQVQEGRLRLRSEGVQVQPHCCGSDSHRMACGSLRYSGRHHCTDRSHDLVVARFYCRSTQRLRYHRSVRALQAHAPL